MGGEEWKNGREWLDRRVKGKGWGWKSDLRGGFGENRCTSEMEAMAARRNEINRREGCKQKSGGKEGGR